MNNVQTCVNIAKAHTYIQDPFTYNTCIFLFKSIYTHTHTYMHKYMNKFIHTYMPPQRSSFQEMRQDGMILIGIEQGNLQRHPFSCDKGNITELPTLLLNMDPDRVQTFAKTLGGKIALSNN